MNIETGSVGKNGFPKPLEKECFQCSSKVLVKYVVPHKYYSRKNNWEYWTNPKGRVENKEFWEDKKSREKDKQICDACLLKLYYNKETYWETVKDLSRRQKLRTYIFNGTVSARSE